jgi:hypothetical protein
LTLKYDELTSNFAFTFNLRRCIKGSVVAAAEQLFREQGGLRAFYKARRCRFTLSNPMRKRLELSA